MIQFESVWLIASFANSRLDDFAFLDEPSFFSFAALTNESCLFHFWDDV